MILSPEVAVELTPDIVGRSTGRDRLGAPWFDNDHDGDLAPKAIDPQSALATLPRRVVLQSFDSTFAMPLPQSEVATRSPAPLHPETSGSRGQISAAVFEDASDAAEWRAVARERRQASAPSPPEPPPKASPMWLGASLAASLLLLLSAGAGFLTVVVTAWFWL